MRKLNQIGGIKYTTDWLVYDDIVYRLFTYMGVKWSIHLRHFGIGAWTIRLCSEYHEDIYLINSINKMIVVVNDVSILDIDGWYYEDLNHLKNKLDIDLISLINEICEASQISLK